MPIGTFIALLRGINVGSAARVPMAELRAVCERIGWTDVRTYIQSGNVVFRASGTVAALERQLEEAITPEFGLTVPVIVRSARSWATYAKGNPFAAESAQQPKLVMLALSKRPPAADALARLRERASSERIERVGDAIWIHYGDAVAGSKVTPGMLDRFIGSPTTTRNWRTVLTLGELAEAP